MATRPKASGSVDADMTRLSVVASSAAGTPSPATSSRGWAKAKAVNIFGLMALVPICFPTPASLLMAASTWAAIGAVIGLPLAQVTVRCISPTRSMTGLPPCIPSLRPRRSMA